MLPGIWYSILLYCNASKSLSLLCWFLRALKLLHHIFQTFGLLGLSKQKFSAIFWFPEHHKLLVLRRRWTNNDFVGFWGGRGGWQRSQFPARDAMTIPSHSQLLLLYKIVQQYCCTLQLYIECSQHWAALFKTLVHSQISNTAKIHWTIIAMEQQKTMKTHFVHTSHFSQCDASHCGTSATNCDPCTDFSHLLFR